MIIQFREVQNDIRKADAGNDLNLFQDLFRRVQL